MSSVSRRDGRSTWRNWAGDQACAPLRACCAGRPRGAGRGGRRGRGRGAQGQRRRQRSLVHRGGDDRRHDGRRRRAQRRARRRSLLAAWSRSARAPCSPTSTRSCTGSAWRWRTSATSIARPLPGRSRPAPTALARSCATSPRRSRRWSWSSPTARVRELTTEGDPSCCARRGSGIGALGAISSVTLRCVPAFTLRPGRQPCPARGSPRQLRGARRRTRPFRALHLSLRRLGAGAGAQPHRGAAAPARPGRRLPQRRRAGELGAGGDLGGRQGVAAGDSLALALRRLARLGQHDRPTAATGSSPTSAASASPRWSTGCRASTGPRRCAG